MRFSAAICLSFAMVCGVFAPATSGGTITYVTPTNAPDSQGSLLTGTNYTSNLGYAFITGSNGPFDIDWVSLKLNTGNSGGATSGSFKLAIHGAIPATPYLAVASSFVHATDTVSFTMPNTISTNFDLQLTATQLPNITGFQLLPNTAYSLFLYNASASYIAMQRTTGLANGTTNDNYTVTNGFTMLDTFRNNNPNYSNIAGSYPTFAISFGATTSSGVPEIDPAGLGSIAAIVAGALGLFERRRFGARRRRAGC